MANKHQNTSIFDYYSIKSRRIVTSVLGVETFGLADECDVAIVIQHDLKQIINKRIKVKHINIYQNTVQRYHNELIQHRTTANNWCKTARDACNEGIIDGIRWIRRTYNLTDAMKNASIHPQLVDMMETGKISYEVENPQVGRSDEKIHLRK